MTAVLNSLVKKNWVTRCRDNADGRCVMVRITEIGRAIILQKHEQLLLKIASSFSALNEKDAVAYVRITQEMLQYFNQN